MRQELEADVATGLTGLCETALWRQDEVMEL